MLPSHKQLLLPVMKTLSALGGSAPARDVVDAVANELALSPEIRNAKGIVSGRQVNLFARRVRWVRQDGIRRKFMSADGYGRWQLTESGRTFLQNIRPGFVITIYETPNGRALWAEAEAAAGVIEDQSVNLIFTSPEYPLLKPKHYGNRQGQEYLDWLVSLATEWKRMLVDDGSLVVTLGPVWQRGAPIESIYQERLLLRLVDELGFNLAQRFFYHSPGKVPSSEWVTIRRVRVRNVMETTWWLSKSDHPKANNRNVLLPYSDRMLKLIEGGGQFRRQTPAGHGDTRGAYGRDNGGSIPTNLITATNSSSRDYYHRQCRLHNLPPHPATIDERVIDLFVRMLTDEGDLVCDFLAGSNKVGKVCETLNRQWITSEKSLAYVSGSKFHVPGYQNVAPDICPI